MLDFTKKKNYLREQRETHWKTREERKNYPLSTFNIIKNMFLVPMKFI